jgi:hypothetical protein
MLKIKLVRHLNGKYEFIRTRVETDGTETVLSYSLGSPPPSGIVFKNIKVCR